MCGDGSKTRLQLDSVSSRVMNGSPSALPLSGGMCRKFVLKLAGKQSVADYVQEILNLETQRPPYGLGQLHKNRCALLPCPPDLIQLATVRR